VADPLASARLKLKRAVEHLDALDEEVRSFAYYEFERLRAEGDPQITKEFNPVWIATGTKPLPTRSTIRELPQFRHELPPRFGVILGDYLSNLRAALDHAVNGIAGTSAGDYTKFPIVALKGKWRGTAKSDLEGVPRPCRTRIERMQPYHGHRRGKRLLFLATLCNLDKHKVLHSTTFLVYKGIWTWPEGIQKAGRQYLDSGVLGDETEVSITFPGPDSAPKVEGGAPYQIAFTYAPGHPTAATRVDLGVLLDEVRAIIVEIGTQTAASAHRTPHRPPE
jgi:hypothetical protein